jgi:serine/threonine protein kinase
MLQTGVIYGNGSYGIVYEAKDKLENKMAIKCNLVDKDSNFIGTMREVDIIYTLHGHPNIVYTNFIYYKNPFNNPVHIKTNIKDVRCDSIYFVFKPAKSNLLDIIHNLTYPQIKKYVLHILLGLEFMHFKNIIHQDIKPANILITHDDMAQLCDFGLSEPVNNNIESTKGVITAWYRSPEIALGKSHSLNADIWSLALVIIEMLIKKPILESCKDNNLEILKFILTKIPLSDKEYILKNNPELQSIKPKLSLLIELFKLNALQIQNFNSTDGSFEQFINLLAYMLVCNPEKRYTATKALNHEFFNTQKSYISDFRSKYLLRTINLISINATDLRRKIMKVALQYFDKKADLIPPKVIFSSINLFDRYIKWRTENPTHSVSLPLLPDEYDDLLLKYYVSLYVFIKYFTVVFNPPGFKILVKENYTNLYAEIDNFERRLIRDVCLSKVYQPTVLEYSPILTYETIRKLLVKYMESSSVTNVDVEEYTKALLKNL